MLGMETEASKAQLRGVSFECVALHFDIAPHRRHFGGAAWSGLWLCQFHQPCVCEQNVVGAFEDARHSRISQEQGEADVFDVAAASVELKRCVHDAPGTFTAKDFGAGGEARQRRPVAFSLCGAVHESRHSPKYCVAPGELLLDNRLLDECFSKLSPVMGLVQRGSKRTAGRPHAAGAQQEATPRQNMF